jgi:hypothetical protein
MKRAIGSLVMFGALIGFKFYNKSASATDTKAHLIKVCEAEKACEDAVNTHFDACFESAYNMGGRHRSSSLKGAELVKCINSRGGKPYFTYDENAK